MMGEGSCGCAGPRFQCLPVAAGSRPIGWLRVMLLEFHVQAALVPSASSWSRLVHVCGLFRATLFSVSEPGPGSIATGVVLAELSRMVLVL